MMKLFARASENTESDDVDEEDFLESDYDTIANAFGEFGRELGVEFPVLRDEEGDIVFRDVTISVDGVARDSEGNTLVIVSFGTVTLVED